MPNLISRFVKNKVQLINFPWEQVPREEGFFIASELCKSHLHMHLGLGGGGVERNKSDLF